MLQLPVTDGAARVRSIAAELLAESRLLERETAERAAPALVEVTGPLPSLQQRLAMIATAVCAYEKFESGLARYRPVAERLRD